MDLRDKASPGAHQHDGFRKPAAYKVGMKWRRKSANIYELWPDARPRRRAGQRQLPWGAALILFVVTFSVGLVAMSWNSTSEQAAEILARLKPSAAIAANVSRQFGYCYTGGGWNCVVDGDTFWMEGVKIRVADIDAPETHPSRCPYEANLGDRATTRLHDLLNQGPFSLQSLPDRDEDRYGRKLRIVTRNGDSLGDQLVSEGLARTWIGHRDPWC